MAYSKVHHCPNETLLTSGGGGQWSCLSSVSSGGLFPQKVIWTCELLAPQILLFKCIFCSAVMCILLLTNQSLFYLLAVWGDIFNLNNSSLSGQLVKVHIKGCHKCPHLLAARGVLDIKACWIQVNSSRYQASKYEESCLCHQHIHNVWRKLRLISNILARGLSKPEPKKDHDRIGDCTTLIN